MLKNILKLEGSQKLNSTEQKQIIGGKTDKICLDGGELSNINNCLCNGGTYSREKFGCITGFSTGKIFEDSTSCCYDTLGSAQ